MRNVTAALVLIAGCTALFAFNGNESRETDSGVVFSIENYAELKDAPIVIVSLKEEEHLDINAKMLAPSPGIPTPEFAVIAVGESPVLVDGHTPATQAVARGPTCVAS